MRDQDGARHMIAGGPGRRGQTGKCLHKYLMSEGIMIQGESSRSLVICSNKTFRGDLRVEIPSLVKT